MHLLSVNEIDNICKRAANLSYSGWELQPPVSSLLDFYLIDFFRNLYNTGLRYNELYDLTRWSNPEDGVYVCDTLKNSNNRTFDSLELSDYFITCVETNTDPYQMCRYSTAVRYFKKVIHPLDIVFSNGGISLHIFRHNVCKLLYDDSYTVQEISNYLGERDNANTNSYINSEIYRV